MEWISVKDRLPEIDEYVLWIDIEGGMWIEELDKDGNSWHMPNAIKAMIPTHWMPLPEPPTENKPSIKSRKVIKKETEEKTGKSVFGDLDKDDKLSKKSDYPYTEEDLAEDMW